MSRFLARALVALCAFMSAASANAGTFDYSSYGVLNNQNVTISLNQAPPKSPVNEGAGSGEILLYSNEVAGGVLPTWCVDIPDWLASSGTFSTGTVLTGLLGTQVNALIWNGQTLLGSDQFASSALQVAIWQEEYGNALTVTASNDVSTRAAQYVNNVSSGLWKANSAMQVSMLTANGANQDQAYLTPVSEPGSVALLGAGMVGLGLMRRRRG